MIHHLVSYSGGKDSGATAICAINRGDPFRLIMCDTGNEHPITMEHAQNFSDWAGVELEIIKPDFSAWMERRRKFVLENWPEELAEKVLPHLVTTGNPFLDLCIIKGRFPSRMAQFCTQFLKTNVFLNEIILPLLGEKIWSWQGVRRDESARRKNARRFEMVDEDYWCYRPVVDLTAKQVIEMHKHHGAPLNPLYKMGMDRVGCMPCINVKKGELRAIQNRFPEHLDRIEEWEKVVSEVAKQGRATFFAANYVPDTPQGSEMQQARAWAMTTRGGREIDMFADQISECASSYGLCE